jgi:hypothetical protein
VNGEDWPVFGYTMVGLKRLENIHRAVGTVLDEDVPGDLFECGVWRGGCIMMMAAVLEYRGVQDRTVWGADSFEGMPRIDAATMPEDAGYDLSGVAILSVGEQQVRQNFSFVGIDDSRVKLVKGWFSETLPHVPVERIAVLRLDGDHYSSTMDVLKNLYDKVSPGGFVIVDDYNSWPPCKQAISAFLAERGLAPEIIPIDDHGVYWRV